VILLLVYGGVNAVTRICSKFSTFECNLVWAGVISSAIGTVILIEIFIDRRKTDTEWLTREEKFEELPPEPISKTITQAVIVSISRFVLVGILGGGLDRKNTITTRLRNGYV
jgi:hypothetical protein